MLVIISDLHLGDGTTAASIPASAFYLFAKRLRQDAHFASMRDGKYHPIEELDVILMGDILDPIHSTRWFYPLHDEKMEIMTKPGDAEYIRPWSDSNDPKYAPKLLEVTRAILKENKDSMEIMRKLASGEFIEFDSSDVNGSRDSNSQTKIPLNVRFHYMVGNHDWYYHLKGEAFDAIRREIIQAMGLSNPPSPFPHDLRKIKPDLPWDQDDAPDIQKLFDEYRVFARHGDYFDTFNFDREKGRDHPTLGDALAMEVINKYPETLKRMTGLDVAIVDNLRQITNVRPAFATPLWISGQIRTLAMQNKLDSIGEQELKKVWDTLADEFLELDFVRQADQSFKLDVVDTLQAAIKISKLISFETLDKLILRLQRGKRAGKDQSFAKYALQEPAFLDKSARYIVYGHTHQHETIPLDYNNIDGNQIYFNSGTWHTYFDLARKDPTEKKFIPYKALTYITFYKQHEHDERNFETWSGAYA
jgi:UDP-2,3-diacylglucosamine pyrophosphatase LpxH